MAWQTPKTDWITNPIKPRSQDFNRIEGNIAFLKQEIENKKGLLVEAINAKQELVTIESSYQELAQAIGVLNKNPRIATGVAEFELVPPILNPTDYYGNQLRPRSNSAKITVSGLPFRPGRIYIQCNIQARIDDTTLDSAPFRQENWIDFPFAIVDNQMVNSSMSGIRYSISGGMAYGYLSTARLSYSLQINDNGFILTINTIAPNDRGLSLYTDSRRYQYWYAYEQEG